MPFSDANAPSVSSQHFPKKTTTMRKRFAKIATSETGTTTTIFRIVNNLVATEVSSWKRSVLEPMTIPAKSNIDAICLVKACKISTPCFAVLGLCKSCKTLKLGNFQYIAAKPTNTKQASSCTSKRYGRPYGMLANVKWSIRLMIHNHWTCYKLQQALCPNSPYSVKYIVNPVVAWSWDQPQIGCNIAAF